MAFTIDAETFQKLQPREYLRQFVKNGTRPDGRALDKARRANITTDVITTAIGSAQVKLGSTLVTCGIKAEVAKPLISTPQAGYIVPNVDLPPLCHPRFTQGPPSEQAQILSQTINAMICKSPLFDLKELMINEGNAVWVLYVDFICLDYDGNVLDAILLAFIASLKSMKLPHVVYDDEQGTVTASSIHFQNLGLIRTPIAVTLGIFDNLILMDPTDSEEEIMDDIVTITLDEDLTLVSLKKLGSTALSRDIMQECMRMAIEQSKIYRAKVDKIKVGE